MSSDTKPEIRRAASGMRWPGDRHLAVVFNVAFEAWTEKGASAISGQSVACRRLRLECGLLRSVRSERRYSSLDEYIGSRRTSTFRGCYPNATRIGFKLSPGQGTR